MPPPANSPCEPATVKRVEFDIASPQEIRNISVVHVIYPEMFANDAPKPRGLADLAMGTIDRQWICETCGCENDCPGHEGHIELCQPIFHIDYIQTVLRILRCICLDCSKLLSSPLQQKKILARRADKRLAALCDLKIKECPVCKKEQPTSIRRFTDAMNFTIDYKTQDRQTLDAPKVHKILQGISDEDCPVLGIDPTRARPDWMMVTVIPVPPPQVRPSVFSGSSRAEDDLVHGLAEIIKASTELASCRAKGDPQVVLSNIASRLQQAHTSLVNPGSNDQTISKSGREFKSIATRLKGKHGRVRGNLMGKRVNFTARTVISPDASLDLDQLGVPRSVAMKLSFPETVTAFNLDYLQSLVEAGPDEIAGANYITRTDGTRIDLRICKNPQVSIGYVVERHLKDNDIVLFNRQPSLHKMSIMAHRIKVMPYSTFRLNLSCTSPYNGDFDGDEMNLSALRSHSTRSEAIHIMAVSQNIISPQSNKPVMSIVQDALLGSRGFTKRDCFLSRASAMNLCLQMGSHFKGSMPAPAILKPEPLWTGKQLMSMYLPKVHLIGRKSATYQPSETPTFPWADGMVNIVGGELLTGIMDKKTLGSSQGGLIHTAFKEAGPEATASFMSVHQKVICNWMLESGASIGIGDTISNQHTMQEVECIIAESKSKVKRIISDAQRGILNTKPGMSIAETCESEVNRVLNECRDQAGSKAQLSLDDSNNFKNMVSAGSKGSNINISQIIGCVGQQNVEGKRISYGFRGRTLPHFTYEDIGPEARGFVQNSYLKGLNPKEAFFHAAGGREGCIDTAIKTSETGYLQRRLVKSMEDLIVKYDGTVRKANGAVLQFLYGEDSLDGARLEYQNFSFVDLSHADFEARYKWPADNPILNQEYDLLLQARDSVRKVYAAPLAKSDRSTMFYSPVNVDAVITNAAFKFSYTADLEAADVLPMLDKLIGSLRVVKGEGGLEEEANDNALHNFRALLRERFCSKKIVSKLSNNALIWALEMVHRRFYASLVDPGEAVGCLSAQSLSQPITQLTLNTFHFAGVASKNVTLGVPRLDEIINVTKQMKTPSLVVHLAEDVRFDLDQARRVQSSLEYTTIRSITQRSHIYYEPLSADSTSPEDELAVFAFDLTPDLLDASNTSPWVINISMDKQLMSDHNVTTEEIAAAIKKEFDSDLTIILSDVCADSVFLLVHLSSDISGENGADFSEDSDFLTSLLDQLLNLSLRGIPEVSKVYLRESKLHIVDSDGTYNLKQEWVLDTDGSALLKVLGGFDGIDATRTYSNDINEVYATLGIEAARATLLQEILAVIGFDGSFVDYRHLSTLVDTMTHWGVLSAISRHGLTSDDGSVLSRCTFEKTVEIITEATISSRTDTIQGVADNIMLGQSAPMGTGQFDLLLDPSKLVGDEVEDQLLTDVVEHFQPAFAPELFHPFHDTAAAFSPTQEQYSPTSPSYVPSTPTKGAATEYSPTSPTYNPGLEYSPSSPNQDLATYTPSFDPGLPPVMECSSQFPTSQAYMPSTPTRGAAVEYSPTSPTYNPGLEYSPSSPTHDLAQHTQSFDPSLAYSPS